MDKEHPVTETRMTVMDGRRKGMEGDTDWLREAVRGMVQELMDAEMSALIGTGRY